MTRRIGFEGRRRQYRELRLEAGEIGGRRDDEQIANEQVLPGKFLDEAHRQAVLRIRARVQVLDEELLPFQMRDDVAPQHVELRRIDRLVDLAPPDLRVTRRLLDHELVIGRAAGMRTGAADERTLLRENAFLPTDRMLV